MSNKTITMPPEEYERLVESQNKEFEYEIGCDGIWIPVDEYKYLKDIKLEPYYSQPDIQEVDSSLSAGIAIGFILGFSVAGLLVVWY